MQVQKRSLFRVKLQEAIHSSHHSAREDCPHFVSGSQILMWLGTVLLDWHEPLTRRVIPPTITVSELRSGVTGFATIYATGSHRFMLQVRNDERDEINLRQKKWVKLTYHWLMYVIISPWNIIEICRTFRRDLATKRRQIVTFEVKTLGNNRKINNR